MPGNSPRVPKRDDKANNDTTEDSDDSNEPEPQPSSPTATTFTALQRGPLALQVTITATETSPDATAGESFAIEGTLTPPQGQSNPTGLSFTLRGTITPITQMASRLRGLAITSTPRPRLVDRQAGARQVTWSSDDGEPHIPASRSRGRPRGSRGRGRGMRVLTVMTQPSSHSQASSLLTPTPKTFTPPISDRPTSMALSSSLPHASTMTAPTFHTFTPPRSHAPTSTVSGSKRARNQSLSSSSDDSMRSRLKKRAKDSNGETRSAQRHNSSRSSMVQPSGGMQAEPNSRRPGGQAATLLATPFSNAVPGFSTSATPFRPQELGSPATTSPQAWQEHPTFGMHVEQRRTASPDEEEEDTKN